MDPGVRFNDIRRDMMYVLVLLEQFALPVEVLYRFIPKRARLLFAFPMT